MTKIRLMKGSPFATIQGEGILLGQPSVFLRTAGCDLRCHRDPEGAFFTCDTPYSLPDYDHHLKVFQDIPTRHAELRPVYDVANQIWSFGLDDLVITGGEPTLQADSLVSLFDALINTAPTGVTRFWPRTTLETNCRRFPAALARFIELPSLSPKLQQLVTQAHERGWTLDDMQWAETIEGQTMLQWFAHASMRQNQQEGCQVQLKIVCSNVDEFRWAMALFRWARSCADPACLISIADAPHTDAQGLIRSVISAGGCRLMLQAHKTLGIP